MRTTDAVNRRTVFRAFAVCAVMAGAVGPRVAAQAVVPDDAFAITRATIADGTGVIDLVVPRSEAGRSLGVDAFEVRAGASSSAFSADRLVDQPLAVDLVVAAPTDASDRSAVQGALVEFVRGLDPGARLRLVLDGTFLDVGQDRASALRALRALDAGTATAFVRGVKQMLSASLPTDPVPVERVAVLCNSEDAATVLGAHGERVLGDQLRAGTGGWSAFRSVLQPCASDLSVPILDRFDTAAHMLRRMYRITIPGARTGAVSVTLALPTGTVTARSTLRPAVTPAATAPPSSTATQTTAAPTTAVATTVAPTTVVPTTVAAASTTSVAVVDQATPGSAPRDAAATPEVRREVVVVLVSTLAAIVLGLGGWWLLSRRHLRRRTHGTRQSVPAVWSDEPEIPEPFEGSPGPRIARSATSVRRLHEADRDATRALYEWQWVRARNAAPLPRTTTVVLESAASRLLDGWATPAPDLLAALGGFERSGDDGDGYRRGLDDLLGRGDRPLAELSERFATYLGRPGQALPMGTGRNVEDLTSLRCEVEFIGELMADPSFAPFGDAVGRALLASWPSRAGLVPGTALIISPSIHDLVSLRTADDGPELDEQLLDAVGDAARRMARAEAGLAEAQRRLTTQMARVLPEMSHDRLWPTIRALTRKPALRTSDLTPYLGAATRSVLTYLADCGWADHQVESGDDVWIFESLVQTAATNASVRSEAEVPTLERRKRARSSVRALATTIDTSPARGTYAASHSA